MTSSEKREQAFIILFEKAFNEEVSLEELINLGVEAEVISKTKFTEELLNAVLENKSDIDAYIVKYSKGWKLERISKVSLAVLRICIGEMLYLKGTPIGVVINEGVSLCKKYAGEEDYSFVNGILSSVAKEIK